MIKCDLYDRDLLEVSFIRLRKYLSVLQYYLQEELGFVLILKECLILSNAFSASISMVKFSFNLLKCVNITKKK